LKIFKLTKKFDDKDMVDRFLAWLIFKSRFDFFDIFFIMSEEIKEKSINKVDLVVPKSRHGKGYKN
jgi:hypothetical protein